MSENVFNVVQMGPQAGTFSAPGAAVPATFLYPISAAISPLLELGSAYPALDRGRNVRNLAGTGYHGIRKASVTLPSDVRFEDIMPILEMCYAGGVIATGVGPYTWVYPFEAVAPTVIPYTMQTGNTDLASAQEQMPSCLINQLQMGFSAITAGQASPWTLSADVFGFDRTVTALTGALSAYAPVLESVQGHLTRFYEGTTSTAYAALAELPGSLRSFTLTAHRDLRLRAYGSAADLATKYGYGGLSSATFEAVIAVSATAKTDLHDVWNTSGASLGERRIRIQAAGTGTKMFTIDGYAGLFGVPWEDSDGERVYKVTGEFADDTTLNASHQITVINSIAVKK